LVITKPILLLSIQLILVTLLYVLYIKITQPKLIGQVIRIAGDKLGSFMKSIKERNN